MNNFGEDYPYSFCYFHPREVVVGVCAACLTEKLLVLAAKQGHSAALHKDTCHGSFSRVPSRKPSIAIPKVFALGSSFLQRLDSRHQRPGDEFSDDGSVLSLDDSFISIKFEDNGQVSWDKKAAAKPQPARPNPAAAPRGHSLQPRPAAVAAEARSVVEHARPRAGGFRWRKRIGHLFQLVRWRRSSKASVSHAGLPGKVDGGERQGWIRSLTRRRTTTE